MDNSQTDPELETDPAPARQPIEEKKPEGIEQDPYKWGSSAAWSGRVVRVSPLKIVMIGASR